MSVQTIKTTPYQDQKAGTGGLRKQVKDFQQKNYLENFIQSVFDVILSQKTDGPFIIGGDGRYFSEVALPIILRMAQANGVNNIMMGQGGLLSSPAVSHLIRKYKGWGGLILSASHNPAGTDGDFGIKIEGSNGAGVLEKITTAIFERTKVIDHYKITDEINKKNITEVDPVTDYLELMESLFDFDLLSHFIKKSGWTFRFDAMNAVSGPYLEHIFEGRLGCAKGSVVRSKPLPDFGGIHADPHPVYNQELYDHMFSDQAQDVAFAFDGDADRCMILGKKFFVHPSDSLAIITENATLVPAYRQGLKGVARGMPTSPAVDRVAKKIGIESYRVPTGWKYFGNLLDANKITICGEDSFGAGADYIREKDGIWACLMWMSILAHRQQSIQEIVSSFWAEHGRYYCLRHDFDSVPHAQANQWMDHLLTLCKNHSMDGQELHGYKIKEVKEFIYHDPIDGSVTHNGIEVILENECRVIYRFSGTSTSGAILRVYLESYEKDAAKHNIDIHVYFEKMIKLAYELSQLTELTHRTEPSLIT